MEKDFMGSDSKFLRYLENTFKPEDEALQDVRKRTREANIPEIQVGKMDGLHLEVLTRMLGARKAVEIGTLAGYSGICIARGLQSGGRLYTFEIDEADARVAQASFTRAGVEDRVQILVGPALDRLREIESEGPFDLVFIDADKENYPAYLEWAERNLRVGGAVLGDNTFGFGMIADEKIDDEGDRKMVEALREFNRAAAQGGSFRATLLPTGEGLTVAVKIL